VEEGDRFQGVWVGYSPFMKGGERGEEAATGEEGLIDDKEDDVAAEATEYNHAQATGGRTRAEMIC